MKNKKKLKEIIDLFRDQIEFDGNDNSQQFLLLIDNAILNALQPMVYDAGIPVDGFNETAPAQYSLWLANAELAYNLINPRYIMPGLLWKFSKEQKEELNNILTEWITTLKAKLEALGYDSELNK